MRVQRFQGISDEDKKLGIFQQKLNHNGQSFRHNWRHFSLAKISQSLTNIDFHFLPNLMKYDCGNSFPLDYEPNLTTFGSWSQGNCHYIYDHITFNLKGMINVYLSQCALLNMKLYIYRAWRLADIWPCRTD